MQTDALKEAVMEQMTCGKGLAENSALPAKLGDLTAAIAKILEIHMTALDLTDENTKKEHDAYLKLTLEYREIALRLESVATHMASCADLPMGKHDEAVMSDAMALNAFERFVEIKQELCSLLQSIADRDQQRLSTMRGAARR